MTRPGLLGLVAGTVGACLLLVVGCEKGGTGGGGSAGKTWDQYVQDLKSPDAGVRTTAAKKLKAYPPTERRRAVADLEAALEAETDATAKAAIQEALDAATGGG